MPLSILSGRARVTPQRSTTSRRIGQGNNPQCLECHSADYRIMKESGKSVAGFTAKYGITCVGCHAPHNGGTVKGVWDEAFDAQLKGDADLAGNGSNLCVECHNGELPEGTTASPGAEIHHPMKEMMDGYGAIDVSAFPSVHKGKCVQCHMPPTSIAAATCSWAATTRSTSSCRKSPSKRHRSRSRPRPPRARLMQIQA